ncbi:MAG: 2-succinyl-5-enolpyruvyl-6-hydroxy-3-cyclohexene-1-carboxylic-acid synthase [Synechococcales bacterium]|nr:2-succinyl-5-enolpyruvyl-6-hydroxy-3-cyclohexene-1-carboxylic-acid synthase [Synechococcales bacterium]
MPLDFRNTNTLWASILVATLQQLGLRSVVISPGSRSTPLTVAFAATREIEAIPALDERSAAFFALGIARQTGRAVALVCTSGTAGANYYPAVIEAAESRVPLLVLTADRPPELRHSNTGQTIDQQKLFGTYPNWYAELATPAVEPEMLAYLRQTVAHAWERSHYPVPGVVHLNLPFRDPLPPLPNPAVPALAQVLDAATFFAGISPGMPAGLTAYAASSPIAPLTKVLYEWQTCDRGLIIAGVAQPADPKEYCGAIARLSHYLNFPVLAEGLSPVRNYAALNPYLISTYDTILRQAKHAQQLAPQVVIRIGEMPTSKVLRQWLQAINPRQWVIDPGDRNLDPTHGRTHHLRLSVADLVAGGLPDSVFEGASPCSPFLVDWLTAEMYQRQRLDQILTDTQDLIGSKVVWLLSQHLPQGTPLFIANSMAVRDVEWFWQPGDRAIRPFFNRGANGIDGTLSTALGMAHHNQSSVLLTGDLALLHDTNGLLLCPQLAGHLTIVLVNNQGGGIFEMLPIAQFEPPFERYFATPQAVNFEVLCAAYGVTYERITSWPQLVQRLNPLPERGVRVLEVRSDRQWEAQWRQGVLKE